ncbi:MAG: tetratricopeptide repeat protein [Candidatus Coatesbacteria bacterium]
MTLPPFPGRLLLRLILLWLVFAVPLAVLKTGNDYVIQPKFAVCVVGAGAVAATLTAAGRWRALLAQPLMLPLVGVCAAAAVSWPAAINRWQAGKLVFEQAGWAVLCLAAVAEAPGLGRVLTVTAASVAVQLWVAIQQIRGNWIVGHGEQFGAGRIYATLGNPSFFGVYLAPVAVVLLCGVLVAFRRGATRRDVAVAAGSTVTLGAVLFLMAKAGVMDAWAGLALGGATAVWFLARDRVPRIRSALLVLLVLAAGATATVTQLSPRIWDRLDYLKVKAFSWHAAAWLWRDHPVLGAGPGEYQTQSPLVMGRVHALWTRTWGVPEGYVAPHDEAFAHQDLLQMLAEGGVAGLGLMLWFVAVVVRAGRRDPARAPWLGALASFLPTMCLHFPMHLASSLLLFWLCAGWAARVQDPLPPLEREGRVRVGFGLAAGVAAVVLSALALRGQVANVQLGEGYRLFRGGAPRLAVPFFERFERLNGHHYEERFYAGALHQALKDDGAAIASYGRALELYPAMQGALYNLGNVHFNRGNYPEAEFVFERVLEINPCNVEAANNLGNALALQGRHAEAGRWYLRAIALSPRYPDALYNLAVNEYRLDRKREARRWLAKALEADPRYPAARELAVTLGMKRP